MTSITIATIGAVIVMLAVVFLAARKSPLEQVSIRVYKPPKGSQIFIEIRSSKFGKRVRHEFYLLTPEQAEIMADKLHLSAYAARNHLRSDTRQESTKIDDWTWIAHGRGPA